MWGDDSEIMSISLFFPDHHLPIFWLADYHQYHLVKVRWTKLMGWMGADYKYRRGPVCQLSERWFWWLSPGGWSPPRGFCYVVVCHSYVYSISITLQKGAISTITGVLKRERARLSHCVAQPRLFWDIFESPPSVVVVVVTNGDPRWGFRCLSALSYLWSGGRVSGDSRFGLRIWGTKRLSPNMSKGNVRDDVYYDETHGIMDQLVRVALMTMMTLGLRVGWRWWWPCSYHWSLISLEACDRHDRLEHSHHVGGVHN